MRRVKFFNIVWDTDGETVTNDFVDDNLPTETILAVNSEIDLGADGANVLSDEFGWTVLSFEFQQIDW